jgi:BlaI family penicillinase repressor
MAKRPEIQELTRRERQIMDAVYQLGSATAVDVMEHLPGKPVNATVRTMLKVLEHKGYLRHERIKGRFVYHPTIPVTRARHNALEHVMETFFQGAEASAVIAILKQSEASLSDEDRERILALIEASRQEGR